MRHYWASAAIGQVTSGKGRAISPALLNACLAGGQPQFHKSYLSECLQVSLWGGHRNADGQMLDRALNNGVTVSHLLLACYSTDVIELPDQIQQWANFAESDA